MFLDGFSENQNPDKDGDKPSLLGNPKADWEGDKVAGTWGH